jgi:hypothetical protein
MNEAVMEGVVEWRMIRLEMLVSESGGNERPCTKGDEVTE